MSIMQQSWCHVPLTECISNDKLQSFHLINQSIFICTIMYFNLHLGCIIWSNWWFIFAHSCSGAELIVDDFFHSYHFLFLFILFKSLSFIWYKPQFLGSWDLCSLSSNCLFLFLCVCCYVIYWCVSQPFSLTLLKLTFLSYRIIDTHLGRPAEKDNVRVWVISTNQTGKMQHRRRKRFQWPSGSPTRLSIIPELQRELRGRKKKREMPQCIPALQIMFQLEASQHSSQTPVWQKLYWQQHTCSR